MQGLAKQVYGLRHSNLTCGELADLFLVGCFDVSLFIFLVWQRLRFWRFC